MAPRRRRSDRGEAWPETGERRMLEALVQLSPVLTSSQSVGEAARQVVEYAAVITGLPAFLLFLKEGHQAAFRVAAQEGGPEGAASASLRPIDVAALDLERRGPRAVPAEALRAPDLVAACRRDGFSTVWVAPIIVEGAWLRGLLVGLDRRRQPAADPAMRAFWLLALQAASAIWNADRYEAEVRAQRELGRELTRTQLLKETASVAVGALEPATLCARALDVLRRLEGAKAGAIHVLDGAEERLRLVAQFGYRADQLSSIEEVPLESARAACRSVTRRETVTHETDGAADPLLPGPPAAGGSGSWIVLPLNVRDEVTGSLALVFPGPRSFGDDEIDLLVAVADQLGLAIRGSTLYEAEHNIATILQASLVHPLPSVAGLDLGRVATAAFAPDLVGGDFGDALVLDESRVAVLIGDVAGKGVRAAGLTGTVRSAVAAHLFADASPAQVLARTNRMLLNLPSSAGSLTTAFLFVLDVPSGRATYANAGHPAPALLTASSCRLLRVTPGAPLSTFPWEYEDGAVDLQPGDVLVLYTDGVTEARRGRRFFGEAGLVQTVASLRDRSAQGIAEGLRDAAVEHAGRLRDDLEILVLRLTAGAHGD